MMTRSAVPLTADAIDEARDFMRVGQDCDDALIAGLMITAIGHCEDFTGRMLINRAVREIVAPRSCWRTLGSAPVSAITRVSALAIDGSETVLPSGDYAIDLDTEARGLIRFLALPRSLRMAVDYTAGEAARWHAIPAGLRQGIIGLVALWYGARDRADAPVATEAILALWRGARRVRLS
ncbi:MAG: hypothetical protein ACKVOP_07610 [Sphingomonadaceae bacterium]